MTDALEARRSALRAMQRQDVLAAFAAEVSRAGYGAVTISDIVRTARISKTTFYEHFADKEAVYLELHRYAAEQISAAIAESAARTDGQPPHERISDLLTTHLDRVASDPLVLAQVQIEASVATPAARDARLAAGHDFAKVVASLSREVAKRSKGFVPLDEKVAYIALAGTAQAVSDAAADGGARAVRALTESMTAFWLRIAGIAP